MTTYQDCKIIVNEIIQKKYKNFKHRIKIDEEYNIEFSRGWVFFYNTENFINDRQSDIYLLVAIPLLVDKFEGRIYKLFDPKRRFVDPEILVDDYEKLKSKAKNMDHKISENLSYDELPFVDFSK